MALTSSLHHSLEKWRNIKERFRLSKQVITKPGYNLHPNTKDTSKIVQNRAKFIPKSENLILWHDIVNELLSKRKRKDKKVVRSYSKIHLDPNPEIKTPT